MIKAFRDSDIGHEPYGEKIGAREVGKPGIFRTLGAVFTSFGMYAGKGASRYDFYIGSDSFEELAGKMIEANPDAAIRAFGAALEESDDPTIRACGEILSDQRKLAPAAQAVAA
jgi:hypothetical protein